MKISEILSRLDEWHAPLDDPKRTADTVKSGDVSRECTGIAVTVCVTVDVIRRAIEAGCNLIIGHETLFYGDEEYAPFLEQDQVYLEKKALLEKHNITVFRSHDHMHGPGGPAAKVHTVTDYIYYGIMKELGWESYVRGEQTKPVWYEIPEVKAGELAGRLVQAFGLNGARIVGDVDTPVKNVFVCEHVFGGPQDYDIIEKAAKADVMIPLEIVDWTLTQYVRDSCQLGRPKAIIEMGHFNVEELGMKYYAKLIQEMFDHTISVKFFQSGDSYQYRQNK